MDKVLMEQQEDQVYHQGGGSGGNGGSGRPVYEGSINGALYGGGGAGNRDYSQRNLNRSGAQGAVRIIALGLNSSRSFPTDANAF